MSAATVKFISDMLKGMSSAKDVLLAGLAKAEQAQTPSATAKLLTIAIGEELRAVKAAMEKCKLDLQLNSAAILGETDERDAGTMRKLRRLCGYVENSSDTTVRISQDDATHSWFVTVGREGKFHRKPRSYFGDSIDEACDKAIVAGETVE